MGLKKLIKILKQVVNKVTFRKPLAMKNLKDEECENAPRFCGPKNFPSFVPVEAGLGNDGHRLVGQFVQTQVGGDHDEDQNKTQNVDSQQNGVADLQIGGSNRLKENRVWLLQYNVVKNALTVKR